MGELISGCSPTRAGLVVGLGWRGWHLSEGGPALAPLFPFNIHALIKVDQLRLEDTDHSTATYQLYSTTRDVETTYTLLACSFSTQVLELISPISKTQAV
jgi:hypothetical protein